MALFAAMNLTSSAGNNNPAVHVPENEVEKLEEKRRKRRLMFAALMATISLVLLGVWWMKQRRLLQAMNQQRSSGIDKNLATSRDKESTNDIPEKEVKALDQALGGNEFDAKLTQDELTELAKALKDKGFELMGSSHCIWTQRQREYFGKTPQDPARRLFETIYYECVSARDEKCSNLQGFPTWVNNRNGRKSQWPGFRDETALKTMLNSVPAIEIEEIETSKSTEENNTTESTEAPKKEEDVALKHNTVQFEVKDDPPPLSLEPVEIKKQPPPTTIETIEAIKPSALPKDMIEAVAASLLPSLRKLTAPSTNDAATVTAAASA